MKELLDKLSSYNIFNFLFPGVVFAVLVSHISSYNLVQNDIVIGVFIYYFYGAIISRVGSLILEPVLRKTRVVTFTPYEDFFRALSIDPKLDVLSETNNMYRTICSLLLCITIVFIYGKLEQNNLFIHASTPFICIIGLFILFILSYKKQTAYIAKRVSVILMDKENK